jgi:hypothetical protein
MAGVVLGVMVKMGVGMTMMDLTMVWMAVVMVKVGFRVVVMVGVVGDGWQWEHTFHKDQCCTAVARSAVQTQRGTTFPGQFQVTD